MATKGDASRTATPSSTPPHSSAASAAAADEVESPSLSNATALARFEFEPGRSKDGTKILMVEWEDDESMREVRGEWHISWEGKSTVLPAGDPTNTQDVNRIYFLLPPGAPVPSLVTLTHKARDAGRKPVVWTTNPLPAIFPPELGASGSAAGRKGVLHTVWGKQRLKTLHKEIENELRVNSEGIGLQMAVQEKEWIEQNFGIQARPLPPDVVGAKAGAAQNPLSPESSDVAVSSFAAIKGPNPAVLAAKPPQRTGDSRPAALRIASQEPPAEVRFQQQQRGQPGGMASLDAASSERPAPTQTMRDEEREDDLFALPISARSPATSKSPFSFDNQDTMSYLKGERTA